VSDQAGSGPAASPGGAAPGTVDVVALSDKVYRLLLAEVRLESARTGRDPGRS
jgi:hypothetical protein